MSEEKQQEIENLVDLPEDAEEVKTSSDRESEYEDFERYSFDKVGDRIQGQIVDSFDTEYENKGYIIEINEETGRVIYPNAQLNDKLEKVEEGTEIMIVFTRTVDTGKPNPMKYYRVYKI